MKRQGDDGYVLLEVMMAIVILVCGILAVTESFRSARQADRQSRDMFLAALRLEGRMFELEKTGRANVDPDMDAELGSLSWTEETAPAESGNWQEHRLSVQWGLGQGSQTLELPTYLPN